MLIQMDVKRGSDLKKILIRLRAMLIQMDVKRYFPEKS